MTKLKTTIAIALLTTITLGGSAVQAASYEYHGSLPILVDQYYEIKNPAGPVSRGAAQELKDPYVVRTVPEFDPQKVPNPQWQQQVILH